MDKFYIGKYAWYVVYIHIFVYYSFQWKNQQYLSLLFLDDS